MATSTSIQYIVKQQIHKGTKALEVHTSSYYLNNNKITTKYSGTNKAQKQNSEQQGHLTGDCHRGSTEAATRKQQQSRTAILEIIVIPCLQ